MGSAFARVSFYTWEQKERRVPALNSHTCLRKMQMQKAPEVPHKKKEKKYACSHVSWSIRYSGCADT
jgi:hypothetical protein